MCKGIASSLKPGGRFVTVNCSPNLDFRVAPSYRKYGFKAGFTGELREGAPITWTFFLENGSFEIENYFLDVSAHEEAFRSAGFQEIRWHEPRLSPQGEEAFGRDYWSNFPHGAVAGCVEIL
jgi:ubiquinone/menaquinone biosynthesis C-methylase UbiE